MGLKTGQAGLNLIKQFEGCRLTAYKCLAGVWTIGYGHTAGVTAGQTITQAEADKMLLEDIEKYEKKVNKYYDRYRWKQNEFDALVSFAFNLGSIDQLTAGGTRSRAVIAEKILLYNKAAGKELAGLARRRQAERELFLKSCDVATLKAAEKSTYKIGKQYVLQANMYVRESAAGEKKPYLKLTTNAKSHAKKDAEGYGILKSGTIVTCKGIERMEGKVWMKIPSGYICASGEGKTYVKE